MGYFIKPSKDNYTSVESNYTQGYSTYAEYNYLQNGITSYIKSKHFGVALKLTQEYFQNSNVIDFGCADGVFLPSLSKYFNRVFAIDMNANFIKLASSLVNNLRLDNVQLVCNDKLTISDLKSKLSGDKYKIIFLLETIEHIGEIGRQYETKMKFLEDIATLIEDDGIIVISAPRMEGLAFLIQRLGLTLTGSQKEPISMINLLKASFFNDTSELEKHWNGGHLGFNLKKLENYLEKDFKIIKKKDLFFQGVFVIGKKK